MRNVRPYSVYLILNGASALFVAMAATVFTIYYVMVVKMNPLQLVLAGTAMEATYFLFNVPLGVFADTFGRRLSVLIGVFLTGMALLCIGAFPLFPAVLLGNAIWGLSFTFLDGAKEAWIAGEIEEAQASHVFLRTAQVTQAAGLIGAFLSVGLASLWLRLPILLSATLMLALGVLLVFTMPESARTRDPQEEDAAWRAMGAMLREGVRVVRRRRVLWLMIGVAVFYGAFTEGFDRMGQAHLLLNFRFPALDGLKPVVWFALFRAGGQALSLLATELARRRLTAASPVRTVRALSLIYLMLAGSVVAFGLAGSFWLALAAYWLVAPLRALNEPLTSAWLTHNIAPRVRATVFSIHGIADSVGQMGGGPVLGAIGTRFSLRAAMLASALFLSPALLLYGRVRRQESAGDNPTA